MKRIAIGVLALLTTGLALASILPLLPVDLWWVRVLAFPRVLLFAGLLVVAVAFAALARSERRLGVVAAFSFAAALLHLTQLLPYLPGRAPGEGCPDGRRLTVMVANVQLSNDPTDTLLAQVRAVDPDLFFVMETNEEWDRALAELSTSHPHKVQEITGSYYGLHLFSRHPLDQAEVSYEVSEETPSVHANVVLPSGDTIQFLGVHPQPPLPGQSSGPRDAELLAAADRAGRSDVPTIVAGDFNAVPWEGTMAEMRERGDLEDPREHIGYRATYKAGTWWQRWPLDHVLHQGELQPIDAAVHDPFGSDHLAYSVEYCLTAPEGSVALPTRAHREAAYATLAAVGRL